jgi:hypothetical protein
MRKLAIVAVWLGTALVMSTAAVATASAEAPTVTKIAPKFGAAAGGTLVTITGTGFNEVSSVHFGPNAAKIEGPVEPTSITVLSPSGTGVVHVTRTSSATRRMSMTSLQTPGRSLEERKSLSKARTSAKQQK